ncbi:MAG: PqqD family protein [Candidatus Latescibacterota bacterium]
MGKKQPKNLLDLVPEQNYPFRQRDDGTVDVLTPRYGTNFIARTMSSIFKNTPVCIHLDQIGTRTWCLCDGKRSVHEIGENLHREFGKKIEPVWERLGVFFKHMESQRMIRWKVEERKQGT